MNKTLLFAMVVAIAALVVAGVSLQKSVSTSESTGEAISDILKAIRGQDKKDPGSVWEDLYKKCGIKGGEHLTLNIHGKKSTFNKQDCTAAPGDYGNNIFVPSESDPDDKNQIIMISGKAKGKWASTADTTYGVRDTCTAPFDGDAAEVVIPPNQGGYCVFARVLGKPTDDPELTLEGSLLWVEDKNGNDLLLLGLVDENGFQTPTQTLTRTKGKVKAVDITGLFEWSGAVCYFNGTNYCYDDLGQNQCSQRQVCCSDNDLDGIYDVCEEPLEDEFGVAYCATGTLLDVECMEYLDEWVFNIGDFVGYMWDTYTDGNFKLANIRFYPM
jgi:hypothetical protein